MQVKMTRGFTVTKNNLSLELTMEDIGILLNFMAASGHLVVFDQVSGRNGAGDEIDVSMNGSAIQVTLNMVPLDMKGE